MAATSEPCAQRRPGPKPQRHCPQWQGDAHARTRSTKAGAETPATLLSRHGEGSLDGMHEPVGGLLIRGKATFQGA